MSVDATVDLPDDRQGAQHVKETIQPRPTQQHVEEQQGSTRSNASPLANVRSVKPEYTPPRTDDSWPAKCARHTEDFEAIHAANILVQMSRADIPNSDGSQALAKLSNEDSTASADRTALEGNSGK